jgi:hypothetical protein
MRVTRQAEKVKSRGKTADGTPRQAVTQGLITDKLRFVKGKNWSRVVRRNSSITKTWISHCGFLPHVSHLC